MPLAMVRVAGNDILQRPRLASLSGLVLPLHQRERAAVLVRPMLWAINTRKIKTMRNSLSAGWDMLLKQLFIVLGRRRPAVAAPLLSFSAKRQKRLGWTLLLCGRGR